MEGNKPSSPSPSTSPSPSPVKPRDRDPDDLLGDTGNVTSTGDTGNITPTNDPLKGEPDPGESYPSPK